MEIYCGGFVSERALAAEVGPLGPDALEGKLLKYNLRFRRSVQSGRRLPSLRP